jgi:hypothetical protein
MQNESDEDANGVPLQADGSIDAETLGVGIFGDSPLSMPFPAAAHAAVLTATGHADDVPETLDALLDRCGIRAPYTAETIDAGLRAMQLAARDFDALRLGALRAALAERLKSLKVPRPLKLVDLAFPSRTPAEKTISAKPAIVPETQPWPEPVDGAAVLDALLALVLRYVVMPKLAAVAVVLWILHTYAMAVWEHTPILAVISPTKRCGKTTLLSISQACVYRPLVCANVTPAVLFRLIEAERPTLLLDEGDAWLSDEKNELRGLVNSGHTRTTAVVARCVGDDSTVTVFSTWAAKMIAMIGKPPDTIFDRSIVVSMRRKAKTEAVTPLRSRTLDVEALPIRRQLKRWADDHLVDLGDAEPDVPETLNDRQADSWRPLLSLADALGGPWPTLARQATLDVSGRADDAEDDTLPVQLLTDIRTVFADAGDPDALDTMTLLSKLVEMGDRPWADYRHGKPLTAHGLSRLLRPFEVFPAGTLRIGARTAKGYRRDAFLDPWRRYVPLPPGIKASQRNSPNETGPEVPISKRHNEGECDALPSVTKSMNTEVCSAVTLSTRDKAPDRHFLRFEVPRD